MTILQSLILGLVEGLTEFIPVSSTFHLIAASRLLGLSQSDFLKLFEVVIQAGAILSIIWLYGKKILADPTLQKLVVLSCIPTFTLGLLLYSVVKDYFFEAVLLQLSVFVVVGLAFIFIESYLESAKLSLSRNLSNLTPRHAILIGLFQVLSMVPGVSRSGSILFGMLTLGYARQAAADYAFILSLPTILAATMLDLYKNADLLTNLSSSDYLALLVGTITAFISALWVMQWLVSYLRNHTLRLFGYYRLLAAIILYSLL